jgi:transcriptional regulator with XRE-family HTH domain
MSAIVNAVGVALRKRREAAGLTQEQFAERFNATAPLELQTTRFDICKYERGTNTPPGDKLLKFLSLGD